MKVTIRFSVDGESDGALRNKLVAALGDKAIRLKPNETGTFEAGSISEGDLTAAIRDFWAAAAAHTGPGKIDHVWFYCGH